MAIIINDDGINNGNELLRNKSNDWVSMGGWM